jgi:hypothetical protein
LKKIKELRPYAVALFASFVLPRWPIFMRAKLGLAVFRTAWQLAVVVDSVGLPGGQMGQRAGIPQGGHARRALFLGVPRPIYKGERVSDRSTEMS